MSGELFGIPFSKWHDLKEWFEVQTGQRVDKAILEDFTLKYRGEYAASRYVPSSADMLTYMGTDAVRWAQEFIRLARENGEDCVWIDEELMIGWFANALGAGEMATHKILPLPELINEIVTERTLNEVERQEGIAYRWLRENLPWPLRGLVGYPRLLKLAVHINLVKVPPFVHYRT